MFFGIWSAYINVSIRQKTFTNNAMAKVLQALGYIVVALGLGFSQIMTFGLIIAKISGTVVSWLFLARKSTTHFKLLAFRNLKGNGKGLYRLSQIWYLAGILEYNFTSGMVLILTKFYTTNDLGYFGLTLMVLSAPLGLIGASYKDVFYQKIAALMNDKRYKEGLAFFKKSAVALLAMGLPICLLLYFFGESLIWFCFWGEMGKIRRICLHPGL